MPYRIEKQKILQVTAQNWKWIDRLKQDNKWIDAGFLNYGHPDFARLAIDTAGEKKLYYMQEYEGGVWFSWKYRIVDTETGEEV